LIFRRRRGALLATLTDGTLIARWALVTRRANLAPRAVLAGQARQALLAGQARQALLSGQARQALLAALAGQTLLARRTLLAGRTLVARQPHRAHETAQASGSRLLTSAYRTREHRKTACRSCP
jgi:hypothetical protein